jgi:hypothetical protein
MPGEIADDSRTESAPRAQSEESIDANERMTLKLDVLSKLFDISSTFDDTGGADANVALCSLIGCSASTGNSGAKTQRYAEERSPSRSFLALEASASSTRKMAAADLNNSESMPSVDCERLRRDKSR